VEETKQVLEQEGLKINVDDDGFLVFAAFRKKPSVNLNHH